MGGGYCSSSNNYAATRAILLIAFDSNGWANSIGPGHSASS